MTADHWIREWLRTEPHNASDELRYQYRLADNPTRRVLDDAVEALTGIPLHRFCLRPKPILSVMLHAQVSRKRSTRTLYGVYHAATVNEQAALNTCFTLLCGRPLTRAFALGDF